MASRRSGFGGSGRPVPLRPAALPSVADEPLHESPCRVARSASGDRGDHLAVEGPSRSAVLWGCEPSPIEPLNERRAASLVAEERRRGGRFAGTLQMRWLGSPIAVRSQRCAGRVDVDELRSPRTYRVHKCTGTTFLPPNARRIQRSSRSRTGSSPSRDVGDASGTKKWSSVRAIAASVLEELDEPQTTTRRAVGEAASALRAAALGALRVCRRETRSIPSWLPERYWLCRRRHSMSVPEDARRLQGPRSCSSSSTDHGRLVLPRAACRAALRAPSTQPWTSLIAKPPLQLSGRMPQAGVSPGAEMTAQGGVALRGRGSRGRRWSYRTVVHDAPCHMWVRSTGVWSISKPQLTRSRCRCHTRADLPFSVPS